MFKKKTWKERALAAESSLENFKSFVSIYDEHWFRTRDNALWDAIDRPIQVPEHISYSEFFVNALRNGKGLRELSEGTFRFLDPNNNLLLKMHFTLKQPPGREPDGAWGVTLTGKGIGKRTGQTRYLTVSNTEDVLLCSIGPITYASDFMLFSHISTNVEYDFDLTLDFHDL